MSGAPLGLDDLRRAIDKCDEGILDLLVERNALSRSVGLGKAITGAAIWRPAREARILRRLLGRFDDPHEQDRIHRIWRVIIATSIERQGGLRIVASAGAAEIALVHFSNRGIAVAATPSQGFSALLQHEADLTVLPLSPLESSCLERLVAERRNGSGISVLARLPFFTPSTPTGPEALVIGRGVPDPSGEDATLAAGPATPPGRGSLVAALAGGLSLFELDGYVRPDDAFLAETDSIWLGAYPRPLGPGGARPSAIG
jgi:chorismate mutase